MIYLHVFTEEESARKVFDVILPNILPVGVYFRVYSHQGKQDLEKALRTALYKNKADFRSVDKIISPNELLLKIIPEYGRKDFLPKLEVANKVAQYLSLDQNSSISFKNTIAGINKLVSN